MRAAVLEQLIAEFKLERNGRIRRVEARVEEASFREGREWLRLWCFVEQKTRNVLSDEVLQIVEEKTGQIFGSIVEWIADAEKYPRYKPDRELTKRWYKMRDEAPILRASGSRGWEPSAEAREIIDRFVNDRLTNGSAVRHSEEEIVALTERVWRSVFSDLDLEQALEQVSSVASKRQRLKIITAVEALQPHVPQPAGEAYLSGLRERLCI